LISIASKSSDRELQKKMVEAYSQSAGIYYFVCDYRTAYELLIRALLLCEKIDYSAFKPRIYNNIGNIYFRFGKMDLAKFYYQKALSLSPDSTPKMIILNNLGLVELAIGNSDRAILYLNKSLQINMQLGSNFLHTILSGIASYYRANEQYDSAFYYLRRSLFEAQKHNKTESIAMSLYHLGSLFFEINNSDSALYYINLSNKISIENNFLGILATNHLVLSKIEESKGRYKTSLRHHQKYTKLKDSVFNAERFGEISQLRRLYEISKVNQQIEELVIQHQIKQEIIHYQRIIQGVLLLVLISAGVIIAFIFLQKRKLNIAYKTLFEKSLETLNSPKAGSKKNEKSDSLQNSNIQNDLLDKILAVMEDAPTICDPEFSIEKLAVLTQSNYTSVSQVINSSLKKNFRTFLNSYRIREAQRLLSEPDIAKYTIETVSFIVGFKSRNVFYSAFKEVTGISPGFYLKSMQRMKIEENLQPA
ncbi:MAG: AraC family transcriptional regulator, partial [Bacteroidales bacterium]|nr:AraC family transcriptional regulator [Bacteroidales bacterium]